MSNEPSKPALLLGLVFVNYLLKLDVLFFFSFLILHVVFNETVFWGGFIGKRKRSLLPTTGSGL